MSSMSQRLWLNIALAILLLVLGIGGYWASQSLQTSKESNTLLTIKPAELNTIVVERYLDTNNPERIEFNKQGKTWLMAKPYAVEANPVKITQLITLIQEPIITSYAVESLDLASFDLNPLKTQLIFNGQLIGFGKSNPVTTQRYLLVNNQLVLVSEVISGLLSGSTLDLVARTLIPSHTEVQEVIFPNGTRSTNFDLRSDWQSASAIGVESVANVAPDLPVVELKLKDNQPIRFQIERTEQDLKLTNREMGLTYRLPANWASKLLPALSNP
ncbi:hypothetical protein [Thiofilum flexile]|uniref:hypothetical protein n=1 Tax=Thiofilum flexile TaxID=125627 RepID=UPI00036F0E41|nr:hypothetical protein [Thiofilum flexile]